MVRRAICSLGIGLSLGLPLLGSAPDAGAQAVPVRIEKRDGKFILLRGGEPLYLRGAVVGFPTIVAGVPRGVQNPIGVLAAAGANAARAGASRAVLDQLHANGMVGVVDLRLRGERNGMDWSNDTMVAAQAERALATVRELKDHPAVAMWVAGNELDYIPPDQPYNPRIWGRLNDLARAIKEIDPNHPVLTVIGDSRFEAKVKELAREGTAFDLLGLNAYGALARTSATLRQHWPKPYIVTEWGPTGHWEVPRTAWGVPIEQTSSEKAAVIGDRYRNVILADSANALGSFVFYWSEKQETTHTWYGLFTEQKRTQGVDVMERHWRGQLPSNLAPTIVSFHLNGTPDKKSQVLRPGTEHAAHVSVLDADGDPLTYSWDVRPEVVIPKGNYAGGGETRAPILEGLVIRNGEANVRFRTPEREGAYRLFVTIHDGKGSIAYANFPFYVSKTGTYRATERRHL